jgi:hypothetical protein
LGTCNYYGIYDNGYNFCGEVEKMKKQSHRFDKRIALIKSDKKNPTDEELHEAYCYLEYCYVCDKPITFFDRLFWRYSHGTLGNFHKRCL